MRRREMVVFTQIITRTISEDTAPAGFYSVSAWFSWIRIRNGRTDPDPDAIKDDKI
jgi:hypothetical protein